MENAKIQKFKCDILSNFQTLWVRMYINYVKAKEVKLNLLGGLILKPFS